VIGTAIETSDVAKRFGSVFAVRDCSISVPEDCICGLVGANGSGKTTLLRMVAGLCRPTAGRLVVHGQTPADDPAFLAEIGYLAQDVPLYRRWTVADHLALGAHLNPRWDDAVVHQRLDELSIPLDRAIGALSGGMRAQVGLALALGKRPRVLLLDEPMAALDPLARRQFLASLAAAVADGGLTVLLSSHLVGDLERVCDHVIVLDDGTAVLNAAVDDLVASHHPLTVARGDVRVIEREHDVVCTVRAGREADVIVRGMAPDVGSGRLSLEDIVLAYLGGAATEPRPIAVTEPRR
jgi:ABC-2 type transport system ATP-binding protein